MYFLLNFSYPQKFCKESILFLISQIIFPLSLCRVMSYLENLETLKPLKKMQLFSLYYRIKYKLTPSNNLLRALTFAPLLNNFVVYLILTYCLRIFHSFVKPTFYFLLCNMTTKYTSFSPVSSIFQYFWPLFAYRS